ncbi:MAG: phosphoglycerate kinase [Candidatus Marsarchaeota archaeon]|nr:phosphoglycerate kinase [Candidatus Marsarchaeota archaeon]MCL5412791.1 phosphoglycerate kinase [Candidatus Marsarchaeota archaeon]
MQLPQEVFISGQLGKIKGKALVRVDINVPVKEGQVSRNNLRFKSCAKSIQTYSDSGLTPIILSHQGRRGDSDYLESMEQHAQVIESLTKGLSVKYVDSLTNDAAAKAASDLKEGEVLMLKNVRDDDDEKAGFRSVKEMSDSRMVKSLAGLAGIFINDAPATMHRSDTSLIGFLPVLPSYLGLQMESELKILEEIASSISSGKKTSVIFGGKKWEKFEYVYEIAKNNNVTVLCGGVPGQSVRYVTNKESFTGANERFINGTGSIDTASRLVREFGNRVIAPTDFIIEGGGTATLENLPGKGSIADIGDATLARFFEEIDRSEMIVYAGPVGRYEKGYNQTIRLITRFMGEKALNYTFGGNSADSVDDIGLDRAYDLLGGKRITSGGSALAFISGMDLPVLKAFKDNIQQKK